MKQELDDCKKLVAIMLHSMEENLKAIKAISAMSGQGIDTTKVQQDIVDIYTVVEKHRQEDK